MTSTKNQPMKITQGRVVFHSSENYHNVDFSIDNQEHIDSEATDDYNLSVSPSNFLWYVYLTLKYECYWGLD